MALYVNSNLALFWMAVDEFGVAFDAIDKVDRKERTVRLHNGTVLSMPDDWDVT